MKKIVLKQIVFILLIFAVIFSCQKDDNIDESIEDTINIQIDSKVIAKRVTLSEVKSNPQLRQSIEKIENQLDYIKKNKINSRVNSTDNSFVILTDEIIQVNTDSTEAFTFRIETPTDSESSFENFVIEKVNNDDYFFYIYKYKRVEIETSSEVTHSLTIDSVSSDQINIGDFQNYLGRMMISGDCLFEVTWNYDCSCEYASVIMCGMNGGGGSGGDWSNGGNDGNDDWSTGDDVDGTGSGSGGSGASGSGTNSGSGSGTSNGSTVGVLPSALDQQVDAFFEQLTDEQEDCMNDLFPLESQIRRFLEANIITDVSDDSAPPSTLTAQYYAEEVIDAICNDPSLTFEEALFEANAVVINFQNSEKINPVEELRCFDLTLGAKLTVYVQQPLENSSVLVGPNQIGHAFIGIEQGGIIRQLGYYPEADANQILLAVGVDFDAEIRSNNDYLYHVSISQNISSSQLTNIVDYIEDFPPTYNVNDYACADFAINIGNLGDMNLPSTTISSLTFEGRSPGILGQEIRAMSSTSTTTISTTSSNSPTSQGTCD